MTMSRRSLLYGVAFAATLTMAAAGCTTTKENRATLDSEARAALDSLHRQVPQQETQDLARNSAGVLVFPNVTQAGLMVGGEYGRGVMFKGGQPAGYYNVTGGSLGLQIGAQTFSLAYFFTTPEALKTFEDTKGFEVGAGLDFAVADIGASGDISSSTLQKPLVIFVWGQQGLMAGVKVEGQKITRLTNE